MSRRIVTAPAGTRVLVKRGTEVIADSRDALVMHEGSYPPVYYLPRKDVRMDRLERSTHETVCPYKGTASYFSLKEGPANAVWSYEQPKDDMLAIKGLLAFYPDKFEISAAPPEAR